MIVNDQNGGRPNLLSEFSCSLIISLVSSVRNRQLYDVVLYVIINQKREIFPKNRYFQI